MKEDGAKGHLKTTDKMRQRASALHRCRTLAEPIAAELGLELFDVHLLREGGRLILRYEIDCATGITHEHCENFSRLIDPLLDEADPIAGAYFLEVSSPGAERPLRNEADYKRFLGRSARLFLRDVNGGRVTVDGRLVAAEDGVITIKPRSGQVQCVPLETVISAHLSLTP